VGAGCRDVVFSGNTVLGADRREDGVAPSTAAASTAAPERILFAAITSRTS
jgi:hypothetical protein